MYNIRIMHINNATGACTLTHNTNHMGDMGNTINTGSVGNRNNTSNVGNMKPRLSVTTKTTWTRILRQT